MSDEHSEALILLASPPKLEGEEVAYAEGLEQQHL